MQSKNSCAALKGAQVFSLVVATAATISPADGGDDDNDDDDDDGGEG